MESNPDTSSSPDSSSNSQKLHEEELQREAQELEEKAQHVQLYESVLNRLHAAGKLDHAVRIFRFWIFGLEELDLGQIQVAVDLTAGEGERADVEAFVGQELGGIVELCGRKEKVDKGDLEMEDAREEDEETRIKSVYPDLWAYLLDKNAPDSDLKLVQDKVAHEELVMACSEWFISRDGVDFSIPHPFGDYAARSFAGHFRRYQRLTYGDECADLVRMATQMQKFIDEAVFRRWIIRFLIGRRDTTSPLTEHLRTYLRLQSDLENWIASESMQWTLQQLEPTWPNVQECQTQLSRWIMGHKNTFCPFQWTISSNVAWVWLHTVWPSLDLAKRAFRTAVELAMTNDMFDHGNCKECSSKYVSRENFGKTHDEDCVYFTPRELDRLAEFAGYDGGNGFQAGNFAIGAAYCLQKMEVAISDSCVYEFEYHEKAQKWDIPALFRKGFEGLPPSQCHYLYDGLAHFYVDHKHFYKAGETFRELMTTLEKAWSAGMYSDGAYYDCVNLRHRNLLREADAQRMYWLARHYFSQDDFHRGLSVIADVVMTAPIKSPLAWKAFAELSQKYMDNDIEEEIPEYAGRMGGWLDDDHIRPVKFDRLPYLKTSLLASERTQDYGQALQAAQKVLSHVRAQDWEDSLTEKECIDRLVRLAYSFSSAGEHKAALEAAMAASAKPKWNNAERIPAALECELHVRLRGKVWDEATMECYRKLKDCPDGPQPQVSLPDILFLQDKYNEVSDAAIAEESNGEPVNWMSAARAELKRRNYFGAIDILGPEVDELLGRAVGGDAENITMHNRLLEATILLALCQARDGEYDTAKETYGKAISRFKPFAGQDYDLPADIRVSTKSPRHFRLRGRALFYYAYALEILGEVENARTHYARALKLYEAVAKKKDGRKCYRIRRAAPCDHDENVYNWRLEHAKNAVERLKGYEGGLNDVPDFLEEWLSNPYISDDEFLYFPYRRQLA